ncbi:SH3 domain-containing protein [Clostridium sp. HBUAS56017]|uniref:SH3 domain-containing protein n=1 Tax=Clostridium sp. HBUAS56017 TaxID=2571128 RepID=UPI001177BED5|nr:SH3 domain-containing protein [Clostridium sp. HBUAS56017]
MNKKLLGLIMAGFLTVASLPSLTTSAAEINNTQGVSKISSNQLRDSELDCDGTITGDGVYLRARPSTSSKIYDELYSGDTVHVIEYAGPANGHNWYKVEYNGVTGYIAQEYVRLSWN